MFAEHVANAQSRRPATIARSLGVNPKGVATSEPFECPEEFGYYPHPTDCSQYYVVCSFYLFSRSKHAKFKFKNSFCFVSYFSVYLVVHY